MVSLDTNHANAFVTAAVENFWTRFDHREMHDVFIVISEGRDGEHIARTVYAASEDDARQTHRENYAGEHIVEVQQETILPVTRRLLREAISAHSSAGSAADDNAAAANADGAA